MTPTAGSTSPPRLWPTCAASPGSAGGWPPAGCRSRRSAQFGRGPLTSPSLAGEPVGLAGQAVRFAAIGVASTIAYLLLFAVARRDRRAASQPARPAEALLVPDAVKVDALASLTRARLLGSHSGSLIGYGELGITGNNLDRDGDLGVGRGVLQCVVQQVVYNLPQAAMSPE
jgi:hypothetical protein